MDYETGIFFAFLAWAHGLTMMVVNVNSLMNKNLQKIGLRISWLNFSVKQLTHEEQIRPLWRYVLKFFLIAAIGVPFIFLSWVQVAIYVGFIIYKKSKDSGVPVAMKEYRWKMNNLGMSQDQVIEESMKAHGMPLENFAEHKAEVLADMKRRNLIIWG